MTRWKVVLKSNRTSCSLFSDSVYQRFYGKDTIVEAEPGSLGIFTFDTEENAKAFCISDETILKVKTFGKGKRPKYVAKIFVVSYFYHQKKSPRYRVSSPKGSICYSKVLVLD